MLPGFTFGQSLRSCPVGVGNDVGGRTCFCVGCPVFLAVPERLVAYLECSGSLDCWKHPPALLRWMRSQGCPPSKGDFLLARMIVSPEGCAAWIYFVGRFARVRLRGNDVGGGGFWFARGIGYCFAWLTSSCLAPLDAFARLSSFKGGFGFSGSCPRRILVKQDRMGGCGFWRGVAVASLYGSWMTGGAFVGSRRRSLRTRGSNRVGDGWFVCFVGLS